MSRKPTTGNLVTIGGGGGKPPAPKPAPNRWRTLAALAEDADVLIDRFDELVEKRIEVSRQAAALTRGEVVNDFVAKADDAKLSDFDIARLTACREALALLDPADNYTEDGDLRRDVIGEYLACLIGAFPNGSPGNPQVFTRMFLEHVAAVEDLNLLVLDAACRHVRETRNSLPPIPVVMKAIKEQQELWSTRFGAINGIKNLARDLAAEIAALKPKFEATKALRDQKKAERDLDYAHGYRMQALDDAIAAQAAAAEAAQLVEGAMAHLLRCDANVAAKEKALEAALARMLKSNDTSDADA